MILKPFKSEALFEQISALLEGGYPPGLGNGIRHHRHETKAQVIGNPITCDSGPNSDEFSRFQAQKLRLSAIMHRRPLCIACAATMAALLAKNSGDDTTNNHCTNHK